MNGTTGEGEIDREALKRAAAKAAVELVETGMIVGLGTGSTAKHAVDLLGERVRGGLRIFGVPTSERTAEQALRLGIPLTDFEHHQHLDITIDGADEVDPATLGLIKGLGGALLREKVVAGASERVVIIVDDSKVVSQLGQNVPVPIEIVPFGWQVTLSQLEAIGLTDAVLRGDAQPYVTDNGNYIVDGNFGPLKDPARLADRLTSVPGVVETGLFLDIATDVIIADASGAVRHLRRPDQSG